MNLDTAAYEAIVHAPGQRAARYEEMLPSFYSFATSAYRNNWADSFHLPPFHGPESLAEALAEQERRLADDAGFGPGMRILDIGCGIGGPALHIARHSGAHVTGVNIVAAHIDIARSRAREQDLEDQVSFVEGDMMRLPFPDASFDGAFSFDAICHAPDKKQAHREIARVLKPGAVFAGCDWLCADGMTEADYNEWIEPLCVYSALPSVLSLTELSQSLAEAGFAVSTCRDLAGVGDMEPNWRLFEESAETIPAPRSGTYELLWQHAVSTARAGRAGKFVVGTWSAVRGAAPGDSRETADLGFAEQG
ncbi:methyltransferase domain-containing protein [Streptomyces sp. NBC_01565]|uniref:class I SAM-dependent methyltransferase n=1 Tax=unclassified Streptomyces TaxID=2593676 RepID=UPI00225857C1|nr:methyltransferase domain-containing protein [Streptomyces sp. NBC_01565]MCX4546753.1 methyltransferase domain-containing protein [Streptomyces sp. NBC_01565]